MHALSTARIHPPCSDLTSTDLDSPEPVARLTRNDRDTGAGVPYLINDVWICVYDFDMAVLRFAMTPDVAAPNTDGVDVTIQDLLDVIDIRRLQKATSPTSANPTPGSKCPFDLHLAPRNGEEGESLGAFNVKTFVTDILNTFIGPSMDPWSKVREEHPTDCWIPDEYTDRLFVYTNAAIDGLDDHADYDMGPETVQDQKSKYRVNAWRIAIAKIGLMESSAREPMSLDALASYHDKMAVATFARPSCHGLWSALHPDGGASIYVGGEDSCRGIPFSPDRRYPKLETVLINGTSRPLAGFSMVPSLLYKRMFLRGMEYRIKQMVRQSRVASRSTTMQNPAVVLKTQQLYAEFLSYRAQCGGDVVSSSAAAQGLYSKWLGLAGLGEHERRLYETIKDMHDLVTDVYFLKNQQRLDFLAIILGVVRRTSASFGLFPLHHRTRAV